MKQFCEILTELLLEQRDKLVQTYENRFKLFESKLHVLLENKISCDCLKQKVSFISCHIGLYTA